MDATVRAWLLSQVGEDSDLADLQARYIRLGTARAVALEVLRGRLAAFQNQPSTVTVSSVVGVSYTENIKSLERKITALESGDPPAPDDPAPVPNPDADASIGLFYLRERPRR